MAGRPGRRGGGAAHGATLDRRRGGVLARASPTSRDCPSPLQQVPRRSRPRPVVPAGSVAIANGHAAVYPTASPGGWHLVGRTGLPSTCARPPRRVGAGRPGPLHRGRGVANPPRPNRWPPRRGPRRPAPGPCSRSCARAAGGRPGRRAPAGRRGRPGAGPRRPAVVRLANRLSGNAPDSASLELTGGGTRLRCLDACHVAVVGATPEVRVDGPVERPGSCCPSTPTAARGRPPARRMPHRRGGGGRLPRAGVVRERRDGRIDRARPRPARGGRCRAGWRVGATLGDHCRRVAPPTSTRRRRSGCGLRARTPSCSRRRRPRASRRRVRGAAGVEPGRAPLPAETGAPPHGQGPHGGASTPRAS